MNLQQLIQVLGERLHTSGGLNTVYGAPITAEGKTLIPVSRIALGFGAGRGFSPNSGSGESQADIGNGMGGGGGMVARPVGVLEVTSARTRFIPCNETPKTIGSIIFRPRTRNVASSS